MRKKFWIGKEIEGRLYGLETLFLSDEITKEDVEYIKKYHNNINHILVGPALIEKMNAGKTELTTWSSLENFIDEDFGQVTIEARPKHIEKIPISMKLKCHILLWVDVPEIAELKSTDSIKLATRSHDMHVFTLFNGQKVNREDYIHDRHNTYE